jgi:hypothetical protein
MAAFADQVVVRRIGEVVGIRDGSAQARHSTCMDNAEQSVVDV